MTTKYTISRASERSRTPTNADSSAPAAPRGSLTLKTYDPVSGTTLKYRTDKVAEVGRLMAGLKSCARIMAASPEDAQPGQVPEEDLVAETTRASVTAGAGTVIDGSKTRNAQGGQGKPTGGGRGKKKGKK